MYLSPFLLPHSPLTLTLFQFIHLNSLLLPSSSASSLAQFQCMSLFHHPLSSVRVCTLSSNLDLFFFPPDSFFPSCFLLVHSFFSSTFANSFFTLGSLVLAFLQSILPFRPLLMRPSMSIFVSLPFILYLSSLPTFPSNIFFLSSL